MFYSIILIIFLGSLNEASSTPSCTVDLQNPIAVACSCGVGNDCSVGQWCYENACQSSAKCIVRPDVGKSVFYGAKLRGDWKANEKQMHISLPVPYDITINRISWENAKSNTLAYLSASQGSWILDTSTNPCQPSYNLTVRQTTFFGEGSKFSIKGSQLSTSLRVEASEIMKTTKNSQVYSYTRSIKNKVPVIVNLVTKTTISVTFKTTITSPVVYRIVYLQKFTGLTKADCPTKHALIRDVQRKRLNITASQIQTGCAATTRRNLQTFNFTNNVNTTIEFALTVPTKAEADRLCLTLHNLDWWIKTSAEILKLYGVKGNSGKLLSGCPPRSTIEDFVLLIGAEDNFSDATPNVVITMEVHSRSCVDHTLANKGVRIKAGAENIKTGSTQLFEWKTVSDGSIQKSFLENLCVEQLVWTFVPKQYRDNTYEIEFEFSMFVIGNKFTTIAAIDIKQGDVMDDIGFTSNIATFKDANCTLSSNKFILGQKFWTKITLTDLIVDAETIVCNTYKIKQTKNGALETTDLKAEVKYAFEQKPAVSNSVICGAELESHHFHISVDGYDTVLETEIVITYSQTRRIRRKLVTIPLSGNRFGAAYEKLNLKSFAEDPQALFFDHDIQLNKEEMSIGDVKPNEIDQAFRNAERSPDTDDMIVKLWIQTEDSVATNILFLESNGMIQNLLILCAIGSIFIWVYKRMDERKAIQSGAVLSSFGWSTVPPYFCISSDYRTL